MPDISFDVAAAFTVLGFTAGYLSALLITLKGV